MTRHLILLLVFAVLLSAQASHAAGLVMQFHVVRKDTDGTSAPILTQQDYTVTLFPSAVDVRSGDKERTYDFSRGRIYVADYSRKTLTTYPLSAIPLARVQQKEQRLRALFIQKRTANPALAYNDVKDGFLPTLGASQNTFSAAGNTLAAFSSSAVPIPDDLKSSYAHFILFETTVHPVIRLAVSSAGAAFTMLNYTTREPGRTTETTLTLTGTKKTEAAGPDVQGFAPELTGLHDLDAAINQSSAAPMDDIKEMERKVSEFIRQKDALRAALAAKVIELSMGISATQNSAVAREAMNLSDAFSTQILQIAGGQPQTTEQFIQNMGQLNEASKKAPDYAYLIEYFRANQIRSILENRPNRSAEEDSAMQQARDKLSGAIIANPWLTGGYCALGDAYFNTREVPRALIMWEQAARLSPGYPPLQRALQLQHQIQRDFPEYF